MTGEVEARLDALLDVMVAFAQQDFSRRAPISDARDTLDAIAVGLNMLAEELDGQVASRRELESAYSALKEAQARLVHSGKLVAIGQLASTVAHEINNPAAWVIASLTAMAQRIEEARRAVPEGSRAGQLLGEATVCLADATAGMERIRGVAGDLRTFSRADGEELESVNVAEVVRAACRLAQPAVRQRALVVLDVQDDLIVRANRGRLGQVITNLLVNAAHAVAERPGDGHEIQIAARADRGELLLSVDDSGPGVPDAIRARIFEPFFTTKPAELGTGLGLSLVSEIVRAHGGSIRVGSSALGGARFEIRLPLEPRQASLPLPHEEVAPRRGLRVLIVDDEPALLRTYSMLLGTDHDVKVANGGREALKILSDDCAFDAILCDLQMPGVDGIAVYHEVMRRAPELATKMIFATGGVYQPRIKDFLARTPVTLLEKPVCPDAMVATLSRIAGQPDGHLDRARR